MNEGALTQELDRIANYYASEIDFAQLDGKQISRETLVLAFKCACREYGIKIQMEFLSSTIERLKETP